eukprot:TRINITY_DN182_c0_g1_i1.p1 TRINITY_DN182_c0_g1~~TRINITY_DN182_c0_g1_i1.p1  ORF type:complete len:395 (-),score=74.29 TRINITY_DN182_c0_g1_i1:585-1769(-)
MRIFVYLFKTQLYPYHPKSNNMFRTELSKITIPIEHTELNNTINGIRTEDPSHTDTLSSHIDILSPFISDDYFDDYVMVLREAFSGFDGDFELCFNDVVAVKEKGKFYFHIVADEEGVLFLKRIQEVLYDVFPEFVPVRYGKNNEGVVGIRLGECYGMRKSQQLLESMKEKLDFPFKVSVDRISLVSREFGEPFTIKANVPLGYQAEISVSNNLPGTTLKVIDQEKYSLKASDIQDDELRNVMEKVISWIFVMYRQDTLPKTFSKFESCSSNLMIVIRKPISAEEIIKFLQSVSLIMVSNNNVTYNDAIQKESLYSHISNHDQDIEDILEKVVDWVMNTKRKPKKLDSLSSTINQLSRKKTTTDKQAIYDHLSSFGLIKCNPLRDKISYPFTLE